MAYEWLTDAFSDIDWGDALDFAGKAYSAYNKGDARDKYASLLAKQEQNNYDTNLANYNAWEKWNAENQAASSANAAARARAQSATEANRLAAAARGQKILGKKFKKSMGMIQPYIDAGKAAVPVATKNYIDGSKNLETLNKYLFNPQSMALLSNNRRAATDQNLGELPAYLK